ncbi:MAG: helix-turn-helix domain-containing protein [Rubrobacter sp.]|nr:helix-turn-helix domain-containing protein [Rubrobacter sp.]
MPHIDYPHLIEESEERLEKLEKRHRYTHLFHRARMLGLLKSGECSTLLRAVEALGYSRRQGQRWLSACREGGMEELLASRVDERGRAELVSEGAFAEMEEATKAGETATIAQAHRFLWDRASITPIPRASGGFSGGAR